MAKVVPLFSSSSGNSFLLEEGCGRILIDCGVTTKRLVEALNEHGVSPEELGGILITHEHTDHIQALKVFTKRYDVPIYASEEVLCHLSESGLVAPSTRLVPLSEIGNQVGSFFVEHFITPHDSVGSVGFRVSLDSGKTFGFATDIGNVTDAIKEGLIGCDCIVLESNYDIDMLKNGNYPYILKRRIASAMGHLQNDEAGKLAAIAANEGCSRFILAHLSRENNLPTLAKQAFESEMRKQGISENDYRMTVALPKGIGNGIVF